MAMMKELEQGGFKVSSIGGTKHYIYVSISGCMHAKSATESSQKVRQHIMKFSTSDTDMLLHDKRMTPYLRGSGKSKDRASGEQGTMSVKEKKIRSWFMHLGPCNQMISFLLVHVIDPLPSRLVLAVMDIGTMCI